MLNDQAVPIGGPCRQCMRCPSARPLAAATDDVAVCVTAMDAPKSPRCMLGPKGPVCSRMEEGAGRIDHAAEV